MAKYGGLDKYRVLEKYHLIVLDGGIVLSIGKGPLYALSAPPDERRQELYYHNMVAAVPVKAGEETIIPLNPEFIRNGDGGEKQDCERKGGNGGWKPTRITYKWLNPIVLGDDLYADYPTRTAVLEKGRRFLFTCKPDSHKWLYDSIDGWGWGGGIKNVRTWTGRQHPQHRYRWNNGVEPREEQPTLVVNYLSLEIWNGEKGKVTYRNSWETDLKIDDKNVEEMAQCVRAR